MFNFKRFTLILVFLFLIPTIGFLASHYLTQKQNNNFYQSVSSQTNRTKAELIAQGISPQVMCSSENKNSQVQNFCGMYDQFATIKNASIFAIVLGMVLVVMIRLAGLIPNLVNTCILVMLSLGVTTALQIFILAKLIYFIKFYVFMQDDIGIIEFFLIFGLILTSGMFVLAYLTIRNLEGIINQLRFKEKSEEQDALKILFYPARLVLEECVSLSTNTSMNQNEAEVKLFKL